MLWMTLRRSPERGAVAMMVAIFFGTGVFFAAAALTIDVGNINADRRQLQNGADAAALSAARDCITTECPSLTGSTVAQDNYRRLVSLANNNAADGSTKLARVDSGLTVAAADPRAVCGTLPGLPACAVGTDSSKLQECPASPFPSAKYVRVYTQTLNAGKTATLLPYSFGAAIAGVGTGANQQACAAVAVGPPAEGPALPITFSACEWLYHTGGGTGGTNYAPPPPYTSPPPAATIAYEVKIVLADTNLSGGTGCASWLGHDLPGGFGWVTASTDCAATITALSWMDVSTGEAVSDGTCKTVIPPYLNKTVHLPVFDCLDPVGNFVIDPLAIPSQCPMNTVSGTKAWYHVMGLAAFHLTGWQLKGMTEQAPLNPANQCDTGSTCIYGWFFEEVDEAGGIGFGSDLGLVNMLVAG